MSTASRILALFSLLLLAGCIPDYGCGDPETRVYVRFEDADTTSPYAAISVVAFHRAETDTLRARAQKMPGMNPNVDLVGHKVLGAPDSVFLRVLFGDSVVFERPYDTDPALMNDLRFSADTLGCAQGERDVFTLPGGLPVKACFTQFAHNCM